MSDCIHRHIVLVGMMGAGKSSVGRVLAKRLDRVLLDSDEMIESRTGRTVREIWNDEGEVAFRSLETEVLAEANEAGFEVAAGDLGENITTSGLDLITLPVGTTLRLGDAILALTGLRNPCVQIDAFADGLQGQMLGRDADGKLVRKSGVMSVVVHGGEIRAGDSITVSFPPGDPIPMQKI